MPVAPPTTSTRLPSNRKASKSDDFTETLSARRGEEHRQRRRRPEHLPADVRILALGIEAQTGQPVQQQLERDAHLEPGQVHPEAEMDAMAPRNRGLRVAEDVEAVRIR